LAGTIKSGYKLKKDGKEIGEIKAIQSEGSAVEKAVAGEKVAISIDGPTVGRQIEEGDELTTIIDDNTLKILEELGMKEEIELANEILK
jgi:translation initiation factor 5B